MFQAVSLTFNEMNLNEDDSCFFDKLTLRDGPSANSPYLAKVCNDQASPITTFSSAVFIKFTADDGANDGRFALSWTFVSQGAFISVTSRYPEKSRSCRDPNMFGLGARYLENGYRDTNSVTMNGAPIGNSTCSSK